MIARDDSYLAFAGHYDTHGWDWYAAAYGPRLFRLLADRGIAPGRALDAGCGTGTLALALSAEGWDVTGLDLSAAMLAEARRKDPGGRVDWRQGDITGFDLLPPGSPARTSEPFDLVTCVADTLNHLETLDDWERAFSRFASHLRPGGRLFFDIMTSRGLERLDKYTVVDVDGRTLILGIIWEPASRRSTVKVASFVPARQGAGLYEKAVETVTEWGQPAAGILQRLEKAGFVEAERLWPAGADPEQEDRLAILARRR